MPGAPPVGGVMAKAALADRPRPPLPPPLPAPAQPGRPPALPDGDGLPFDPAALEFLAADAAARAHACVSAAGSAEPRRQGARPVHSPFPALPPWEDAIRLAATAHPTAGLTSATRALYRDLAAATGRTTTDVARSVAAWRQGGPEGLALLDTPWDPPAGDFDRARSALLAADLPALRPRHNHLTDAGPRHPAPLRPRQPLVPVRIRARHRGLVAHRPGGPRPRGRPHRPARAMTNLNAVEGLDALTRSLAQRTPEQLAALLTRHAEPLARRPAPTELRGLASALWSYETLHQLVLHLDHPRLQVLAATARISQERAGRDAPGPAAPAPGADYQSLMAHRLSFAASGHRTRRRPRTSSPPSEPPRPDPRAPPRKPHCAHLYDDGLAAPTEDGTVVVPPRAPQLLAAHDLGPFLADAPRPAPDDTADPATPAATVPPRPRCTTNRRAAAATLAATVDRLLASLATQPAALRKSGGLAVREIKRLAKAAGATEPHTRLLLDLTLAADLIALTRTPSGITALPTGAYDDWLGRPPGARLAPVLAAWSGLWDIPTHTPFGETPTALVRGHDRHAPALRHALLAALADRPPRRGSTPPAAAVHANLRSQEPATAPRGRISSGQRTGTAPSPSPTSRWPGSAPPTPSTKPPAWGWPPTAPSPPSAGRCSPTRVPRRAARRSAPAAPRTRPTSRPI